MRFLFWRRSRQEELAEEIESHLQMAAREREERGETARQAEQSARREFGNAGLIREVTRDQWGWRWLETLLQDLRFALRMLRKSPGFTAVAVLTLALGIGANTAIFSIVEAQIWAPLPFPDSKHLLFVGMKDAKRYRTFMMSAADFQDWLPQVKDSFVSVCAFQGSDYHATPGTDTSEMVTARPVSSTFFETLRMPPVIGRAFLPEEQQPGRDHEVILSYAYWQSRYASNPKIVGTSIVLDGSAYTIVGVAPSGLRFEFFGDPDMYVPLLLTRPNGLSRSGTGLLIVAREKPGVPLSLARKWT